MNLKDYIRDIPDFPKPGIIFKDITPLFRETRALKYTLDCLADNFSDKNINVIAGAEARGFLLGPGLAERLGAGFVPIRKPGKLPSKTIEHSYSLEYGTDTLEIHSDAIHQDDRVILVDDLLATGGTIEACSELVKKLGGEIIGMAFIIELAFLNGRDRFPEIPVHSLIQYSGD